jgi:hypothetical protein
MQGVRARLGALLAQQLRGLPPGGAKKRVVDKGARPRGAGVVRPSWRRRRQLRRLRQEGGPRPACLQTPTPTPTPHPPTPTQKGPAKVGELSRTTATGIAIRKGESDPPLLPDDQYPPWLFELAAEEPSTAELQRQYENDGLTLAQARGKGGAGRRGANQSAGGQRPGSASLGGCLPWAATARRPPAGCL